MKSIRALLGLAFIVVAFYVGWMVVPPYFHAYQFQDVVAEEARLSTYSSKSEEDIRQSVAKKAQDLNLPIQPEQINVSRGPNSVDISVDYTVHVALPAYPLDLKFSASSKNKGM